MGKNRFANTKEEIAAFFDEDSKDYVKYKYMSERRTYMSVRHENMLDIVDSIVLEKKPSNFLTLDAGCGPGLLMCDLAERGIPVAGVDRSVNMLKTAKDNNKKAGSHFFPNIAMSDIESLPFKDNTFDLICSAGVIEYLKNDKKALCEFHRILTPGGFLLISVTNKYSYNLVFDNFLEFLKKNGFVTKILSFIKSDILKLGKIKRRHFTIRKHSPLKFKKELKSMNFHLVHTRFFFFNFLPHPLNLLTFSIENIVKKKIGVPQFLARLFLGEGYMVLTIKKY